MRACQLFSVLLFFLLFTHCVACFWWIIGYSQGENGWQYRQQVVPLLLQGVSWFEDHGLAQQQSLAPATFGPAWLPLKFNQTAIHDIYVNDVGLGRMYITSL